MNTDSILLQYLKKKHYIEGDIRTLKKDVFIQEVELKMGKDLFIRDSILGVGTILKEDLEKHFYITTVKIGLFNNVCAYACIERNDKKAVIAVYAKEGMIKQNLAEKAALKLEKCFV